jgi:hypothetical protein
VNPEHVPKLKNILTTLHAAPTVQHMDLPGSACTRSRAR